MSNRRGGGVPTGVPASGPVGGTGRAAPAEQGQPLGNLAKFASAPSASLNLGEDPAHLRRLLRWALQSAAGELLPDERVALCLHRSVPGKTREVWRAKSNGRAHYKNLMTCGNVWHCPICAAKISERRRAEMKVAFNNALGLGLTPIFVTFTTRHNAAESCNTVLDGILGAYRGLKAGRIWQRFAADFDVVGSIRALESTVGNHGWHCHLHSVFFVKSTDLQGMQAFFQTQWKKALSKMGRDALAEIGAVALMGQDEITDYLNKAGNGWDLESELTKSSSKLSRGAKGRTPFQLLRDYGAGDEKAGKLFQEYAHAFKGKSQLQYSPGLKKLLGIAEVSDEEIAEKSEAPSEYCASIMANDWSLVERYRARGELLEVATTSGVEGVQAFLAWLRGHAEEGRPGVAERSAPKPKGKPVKDECILCGKPAAFGHLCGPCREKNQAIKMRPIVGVAPP